MAKNGVHELFDLEYDIDEFQSDLLAPFGIYDDIPCDVVINSSKEPEQEQKDPQKLQEETHTQIKPVKAKSGKRKQNHSEQELKRLQKELDVLLQEQQNFVPTGNRKEANALSARLHRKRKELHLATLESQNSALLKQVSSLLAENKQLKEELRLREPQQGEFSITVPETTMLIKYRSPTSSPMKPKVEAAQQSAFKPKGLF